MKLALALNRAGLLILVDHARPERLGDLVRALLPEHPELDVYTDVRCAVTVPGGSTLVLVPSVEDAEWLNLNRPLFALRQLRVVLFCETGVSVALAQQAVDFFDWISHRVECPGGPPRYAVVGLRCALAARAPGVVWAGGDLDASFASARPRRKLRRMSAALPYPEMVERIREARSDWIAWTDVDIELRLWRVRWALIEAGRRGRVILVEPCMHSPGWWAVHARVAGIREARNKLEAQGARAPGRLAALVDFEPEAVELLGSLMSLGDTMLEAELRSSTDPGAKLARIAWQRGVLAFGRSTQGEASPLVIRDLGLGQNPLPPQEIRLEDLAQKLERGEKIREEAEVFFRQVLLVDAETLRERSEEYAASVQLLAGVLERKGQYSEAEALMRRALVLQEQVLGVDHPSSVESLHALSAILSRQGKYEEAENLLRQVLALKGQILGVNHPSYGMSLHELAIVLWRRGKYAEAETLLRQALIIDEKVLGASHPSYGESLQALAVVLDEQGKYEEAEELLRRVVALFEGALGAGHPSHGKSKSLRALAGVLSRQGKYGEAEDLLCQELVSHERALGASHPSYGELLRELANVMGSRGKHAKAEELLRQALAIHQKALVANHPSYGVSLYDLAVVLSKQGKYREAEELLHEVRALFERALGVGHPLYEVSLHALASVLARQGRYGEAESLLRQTLAIRERALGASHPSLAPTLCNLGWMLAEQGQAAQGEELVRRALELVRSVHGDRHPEAAQVLNLLARIEAKVGRESAPDTARQALEALEAALGVDHPITLNVAPGLRAIMTRSGSGPMSNTTVTDFESRSK